MDTATTSPAPLPTAALGASGPRVGVQGLGCMGMSFAYGPTDERAARAALDRALELGVTLFDSAEIYGDGDNERFLSPFVRAHRDRITVASKFGIAGASSRPGGPGYRNDPASMRRSLDGSLKRLGVDAVDLYYLHRRDPAVPIEETVGAMAGLVAEGKVRHLGLSEVTGDELRAAHAVHPIAAVQSEWSLFSRDVERTAVPAARDLGVAFVPYSPLGRGFLTGAFADASELAGDDFRRLQPRMTGENARANGELLRDIAGIAAHHRASPGQIALAWVHAQAARWGITVVPIPGTRRPERVAENTAATRIVLAPGELSRLDAIAARVAGDRYADMSHTSAGRE